MFSKSAFANSAAIVITLFYCLFTGLRFLAPEVFAFLFNAQFAGVEIAPLLPEASVVHLVGTWIALTISVWAPAYLWAWLYNTFVKEG